MGRFRSYHLLLLLAVCGCKTSATPQPHGVSTNVSLPATVTADSVATPDLQQPSADVLQVSAESVEEIGVGIPSETHSKDELSLLRDTLSITLTQNPDLVVLRQTERVGRAVVGVANTYPFNPFVQVQATPYQEDGGTTAHYVLLMQRLQLAHQQQYREESATSALTGIRWNIHQAELQAVSLTAQLYFTMLHRRGLQDIAQSSQDNNALLLESVEKRFKAGDAAASDVATVRFDADATLQQLRLAEANYQSAVRDLLRQMGMPATSMYKFVGDIQSIRWRLPANHCLNDTTKSLALDLATEKQFLEEAWIKDFAAARPDVLAARANIAVARANFRLASASRVPDVNVGPYYQQNPDGLTHVGFRADMNLPVIDTGRPLQSQRSAELNQQSVAWNQLSRRAELEGLAAYERYKVAYYALEEGSQNLFVMPQELQSLERQFRAGEVDVVRAIQARTSILQKQRAYLDLLNEAAQSAAAVVGAMGIPIEELIDE